MGIHEATPSAVAGQRRGEAVTGRDQGGIQIGAALLGHDGGAHVSDDPRCIALMEAFVAAHPDTWNEDIGNE